MKSARQHSFVEIGQKIISTAILSLPHIQVVHFSVIVEKKSESLLKAKSNFTAYIYMKKLLAIFLWK